MSDVRTLQQEKALTMCREILAQELWFPLYEDDGPEAVLARIPLEPIMIEPKFATV